MSSALRCKHLRALVKGICEATDTEAVTWQFVHVRVGKLHHCRSMCWMRSSQWVIRLNAQERPHYIIHIHGTIEEKTELRKHACPWAGDENFIKCQHHHRTIPVLLVLPYSYSEAVLFISSCDIPSRKSSPFPGQRPATRKEKPNTQNQFKYSHDIKKPNTVWTVINTN